MTKNRAYFFIAGLLLSIFVLELSARAISPVLGPPLISWNTMEDAKKLKLEEYLEKYQNPEYVFMGNSTTLIGLNPSIFDASSNLAIGSSFNAAMNGSDIKTMRDFALSYLIKEVQPKNLVLLFSNTSMIQSSTYKKIVLSGKSNLNNFYLYKYRNTFRDPMTINTVIRVLKFRDIRQGLVYRWADNLDDFGYTKYETTNSAVADIGWVPSQASEKRQKPRTLKMKEFRYLEEIRDAARTSGVNLIIGTVPTLERNDDLRGLTKLIAEQLNIEFVQGNDALGEGKYFQDGVHLNIEGAKVFSEFLANKLRK